MATVTIVLLVVLLLIASGGYMFVRQSFPKTDGTIQVAGLKSKVEVCRDQHGIPHLYADNLEDLFFAQGYVHAQDFRQIQADTYSIPGEKLVPYLLALELQGTLEEQAMEQLRAWDFHNEVDSPAAAIFQVFYLQLVENTFADKLRSSSKITLIVANSTTWPWSG